MENKKIIASIIIPVYNAEEYLSQCINSVINQTLKEIEIICVDDGSEDNSLAILEKFSQLDSRIVVKHQSNSGAGAARNCGLKFAKGKYLTFLDADDFFEAQMIEDCVEKMDKDNSDILVFSARQFDNKNKKYSAMPWSLIINYCPTHSPFGPMEMSKYLFNAFQNWPWNKMFRHSFVKSNGLLFQEIPRTNDMSFVCMALALADKISIINKSYTNYRVNTGTSLQQTNDKAPLSFWCAYKETKRLLMAADKYMEYEQSFLNWVLDGTLYNLRSVKSEMAHLSIISLIRNSAEDDFGFLNKPIDYYYDNNLLMDYCLINFHESKSVQYIRELVERKNEKISNLYRELSELKNKVETSQAELQASQAELQTSQAELQTSQAELQASRAELQASRAELQAIVNSKAFKLGTTIAKPWRCLRDTLSQGCNNKNN